MSALSYAMLVTLLRNGAISMDEAMARGLEQDGAPDAAHEVRAAMIEALGEEPAHWARNNVVALFPNSDGGKS